MATPLRRILLPLDGSAFAESALPCAAALASAHRAELLLAHAVTTLRPAHAAIDPAAMGLPGDAELAERASAYLEAQAARAREFGVGQVRTRVLHGAPVEALAEAVAADAVDLVVLTTHGRGAVGRTFLGGVAHGLLHALHIPLLLLHPDGTAAASPGRFRQALVPIDVTGFSEPILGPLQQVLPQRGATVTLLNVVQPPFLAGGEAEGALVVSTGAGQELVQALEQAADAYVAQLAGMLRQAGHESVRGRVEIGGSVVGAILDVADEIEADLVAMATHAHAGARRLLVGSVTDKVVRGFRGALLVCHPLAPEAD